MNAYRKSIVLFTLPVTLALLGLLLYPLLYAGWISVHGSVAGQRNQFVGAANFLSLLTSSEFAVAARNTTIFTVTSTVASFLLGFSLAVAMQQVSKPLRWVATLLILPLAVMPVVSGLTWGMMLNPSLGVVNALLQTIGVQGPLWATDTTTALATVIMIDVWQWTPFCYLILFAGLQALPHEPFEAARIDGAGAWHQFRFVTVPLLAPIILITLIFRLMEAFRAYDVIYVITQGGPGDATQTMLMRAYYQGFQFHNFNMAAVYGILMLIITTVVAQYAVKLMNRSEV